MLSRLRHTTAVLALCLSAACGVSPVTLEADDDAGPTQGTTGGQTGGTSGGSTGSTSSGGTTTGGTGSRTHGPGGESGGSSGGFLGGLDGGVVECGVCVISSCGTDLLTCFEDPACAMALDCIATTCLSAGLDPACLLGCAGSDATGVLSLVTCVAGTCGATCLSALGGLGGGGGDGGFF